MEESLMELKETGIYADDQDEYLKIYSEELIKNNIRLIRTQNLDQAIESIIKKKPSFFICDLKWDYVKANQDGYEALRKIRKLNKHIFLALLTSWENIITNEQEELLKRDKIKIYPKGDVSAFVLNFKKDFLRFKLAYEKEMQSYFNDIKSDTITHLKNISNQDAPSKWGSETYKIKDLINEVENETDVGKEYMRRWYKAIVFIGREN